MDIAIVPPCLTIKIESRIAIRIQSHAMLIHSFWTYAVSPTPSFLPLPCVLLIMTELHWPFFSFSSARQIGFDHASECPHLCTLAYDYLRKNKGYEENIFAFFQNTVDPESLIVKFIEELDKCILGYFSFHWKCSTYMITQVKRSFNEIDLLFFLPCNLLPLILCIFIDTV